MTNYGDFFRKALSQEEAQKQSARERAEQEKRREAAAIEESKARGRAILEPVRDTLLSISEIANRFQIEVEGWSLIIRKGQDRMPTVVVSSSHNGADLFYETSEAYKADMYEPIAYRTINVSFGATRDQQIRGILEYLAKQIAK